MGEGGDNVIVCTIPRVLFGLFIRELWCIIGRWLQFPRCYTAGDNYARERERGWVGRGEEGGREGGRKSEAEKQTARQPD